MVKHKKLRFEDIDPQIHGANFEVLKKRRKIDENPHDHHDREHHLKSIENQNTFVIETMLLRYQAHLGIRGINQLFFTDFTRNRKGGAVGVKNPRFYIKDRNREAEEDGAGDRIDNECIMTGTVTPLLFNRMLDSIARKLRYRGRNMAKLDPSKTASGDTAGKFVEIPENREFDDDFSAEGTKYSEKLSFQQYVGRQAELDSSYNFQIMMLVTVRNIREYRGVIEMDVIDFELIEESGVLRQYRGSREYKALISVDAGVVDKRNSKPEVSNGRVVERKNPRNENHYNADRCETVNYNLGRPGKSTGLDGGCDLAVDMNKRQYYTIKQLKQLQRSGKADTGKLYWVIAKMADFQPLENIAYKTGRFGPLKLKEVLVLLVDVSVKSTSSEIVASPMMDDWCVEAVVVDGPELVLRFWVADEIEEVYGQQEKMARYVAREMNRVNEWEVRLAGCSSSSNGLEDGRVSTSRWGLLTTLRQLLEKYS